MEKGLRKQLKFSFFACKIVVFPCRPYAKQFSAEEKIVHDF